MESKGIKQSPAVTDETLGDRAVLIHRRFKAGRLNAMGQGIWEHWRPEVSSLQIGGLTSAAIFLLEPSLWMDNWPEEMIRGRIPGLVALSLLLVLPFNGWLFDRYLSSKTPRDASFPRWLLVLRFLALSLPLFGLHVLSCWRTFLKKKLSAKFSSVPRTSLNLYNLRCRLSFGFQSRALYRSNFFFGWTVTSFFPIFFWALWLAGARELGAWHRPLVLGTSTILHVVVCLHMTQYVRWEIRRSHIFGWRRALILIAPILGLFALPGLLVGMAAILTFTGSTEAFLSSKIHASRTGVNRDPLWQGIQDELQQRWRAMPWFSQWRRPAGLTRVGDQSHKDRESIALYRLKTLLLAFESMSLIVLLFLTSSLKTPLGTGLPLVYWTSVVLAGTGVMIQMVKLLAGLFRIPRLNEDLSRYPYGRYLLLTQAAVLIGVSGGDFLMHVSIERFGDLLARCTALCALLTAFFLFIPIAYSSKETNMTDIADIALWGPLYLSLTALGGIIFLQGENWRASLLSCLRISAALSPLWSLGLFLALGAWLLRPFSWRHIFDRRLPPRLRAALAFVTLTGALPMGGIAIPFWIYAQHRLWPKYEKLLWNLKTS